MWLENFLIIFSCCFGINLGQQFNSTVFFKSGSNSAELQNFDFNRIVGGKPINIDQVPYQIALYRDGHFNCGGSIISADWVVTAAHCVDDGGYFGVRAGSRYIGSYGQIRYARYVVIHSKYNSETKNNDIALIRVRQPFKWTPKVRPVHLARPTWKLPQKYFISGWGTRNENSNKPSLGLRGVMVEKILRSRCQAFYKNSSPITENMICAAFPGKDACQGDSGGPLVFKRVLYGIVSFGVGCARSEYPGVYTDVREEYSWIRNAIKQFGGKMPQ